MMRPFSPATVAALIALVLAVAQVASAHFTVFSPAPSRDKQAYPTDNRRFWPIGPAHLGEGVLRPVRDCLSFPRRQTATVAAGSTVNFGFEIGNGAAHIGLCTGRIINLDSGAQYMLADQNNCVSNGQNFRAVMPNVACPRCVAKIMVTAVHLGAERPEFYDSCVDLVITGGSPADPAPVPQPPTRPTAVPSQPAPPAQPGTTTTPNMRPTPPVAVTPTTPGARPPTSAATTTTTTTTPQAARPTNPQVKPSPPASLIPQEPIVQPTTIPTATTTRSIPIPTIPTIKPEPGKPEPGLEAHPIEPKPVQKPAEPTPAPQPKPQPAPAQPQPQPQPQPPKSEPQPAPQPQKPELPRTPRIKDVKPWWEQGPCKSGAMACGRDGSTLRFCMGGKWIVQAIGEGNKCKMSRDGQVPVVVRE